MRLDRLSAPIAVGVLLFTAATNELANSHEIRVADLVREVCFRANSTEDKKRAEDRLKEEDAAVVLPAILQARDNLESSGDRFVLPYFCVDEDKLRDGERAERALDRIWHYFVYDKRNAGKALVLLLKQRRDASTRAKIIAGFSHSFVPAAEEPLVGIMRDEKDPDQLQAASALGRSCSNRYGPTLIDRVADNQRSLATRHDYFWTILPIYWELQETEKKRLIRVAFALLNENRSYFTAGYLGHLVGVEFGPDSKNPRYLKEDGLNLNREYFEETVRNALDWWVFHEAHYAENAGL